MTQENKKISFGFSKTSKKPVLKPQTENKDEKEYIKCIDDKSIKLFNEMKAVNGPLVIPLVENNNSWKDKLIEKLNSKSASSASESSSSKDVSTSVKSSPKNLNSTPVSSSENLNSSAVSSSKSSTAASSSKNSTAASLENSSTISSDDLKPSPEIKEEIEILETENIKQEIEVINIEEEEKKDKEETEKSNVSKLTQEEIDEKELDRQAVLEILNDLNKEVKVEKSDLKIETAEANIITGEKESTLEDYDKIPIDQFGLAMLRGMGWQPDKGIGKSPQLVTTVVPLSRPRGMGLGADKVVKKPASSSCDSKGEKLKLEKGCFVKVNAGKFLGRYGVLKGFDENAGRVLVELSLSNNVESFNEFIVDRVSKEEFDKNSKVINISKYEEYKNKDKDKEEEKRQDGKSRVNGHDERSREEDRREVSRSKEKRRDRERSRSKERSRGSEKYQRRDRERDRSQERRSRHKKSKHHKKHRH